MPGGDVTAYTFETITTAQALSFDSNFDSLVFTGAGATASGVQIAYDSAGQTGDIAITSQGRTVVFGQGFRDEDGITFPDGSAMSIGGTFVAPELHGGPEDDAMFAGVQGGNESGGPGNDTLVAHNHGGFLNGGSGADLFIIHNVASVFGISTGTTTIDDWTAFDRLSFGPIAATPANYSEIALSPNASMEDAAAAANGLIASGAADFVAVQLAFGVAVFADANNDNGVADAAVLLEGSDGAHVTLAEIDPSQIVATAAPPTFGAVPFILAPPAPPGSGASGTISGNMALAHLHDLNPAIIDVASDTEFRADGPGGLEIDLIGHGITYTDSVIANGAINHVTFVDVLDGATVLRFDVATPNLFAGDFSTWLVQDNVLGAFGTILKGNDTLTGGPGADLINGGGGDDAITGGGGGDTLIGDQGHDTLTGGASADHLIGGTNSDLMIGGGGADVFEFDVNDSTWIPGVQIVFTNDFDHIADWTSSDVLQFFSGAAATSGSYAEITVATALEASSIANSNFGQGIAYTVAQVGLDVLVFAPADHDAIVLVNRTLADISPSNIVVSAAGPVSPPPPPVSPPPPVNGVQTGTAGDDSLTATSAASEVHGGAGNDTIAGGPTADYLRGEDGNDSIQGGAAFDDINGNKGDDTIDGGSGGGDWLVGGQGNDLITAHAGDGLLYGNLGNDTLIGSNGADIILGGQADDSIQGGAGNDYVSGDRGNDTETGGAGADTFHSFSGAGIDRVLDFNMAEGDRVLLDPGTHFTVSQVGADTVVDLGAGDQVILVGINMASLTGSWIVTG